MRHLRALIAAALRDTAVSLGQLFAVPSSTWDGSPPSLGETVTRARDLLDDGRYLPGPDHADPGVWKSGVSSSFLPEKMNRHRITRIFCHCRGIGNTLR